MDCCRDAWSVVGMCVQKVVQGWCKSAVVGQKIVRAFVFGRLKRQKPVKLHIMG